LPIFYQFKLNNLAFAWTWHGENPVLSLLSEGKLHQISGYPSFSGVYAGLCICLHCQIYLNIVYSYQKFMFLPSFTQLFSKEERKTGKKKKESG